MAFAYDDRITGGLEVGRQAVLASSNTMTGSVGALRTMTESVGGLGMLTGSMGDLRGRIRGVLAYDDRITGGLEVGRRAVLASSNTMTGSGGALRKMTESVGGLGTMTGSVGDLCDSIRGGLVYDDRIGDPCRLCGGSCPDEDVASSLVWLRMPGHAPGRGVLRRTRRVDSLSPPHVPGGARR